MSQFNNESTSRSHAEERLNTLLRELQRPATIVCGVLEMLLRELPGKLNEDQKDLVVSATRMSTYMTSVIYQAIVIQDIEAGALIPEPTMVNMPPLITSIIKVSQDHYRHKKHNLTVHFENDNMYAYIDENQTRIALLQVIENAMKYTPTDRNIIITCKDHATRIEITIKDRGIGIPQEYHHRLFHNPITIPRQHYDEPFGLGLGLFIAKRLFDLNNSTIILEESTFNGSSFIIQIPKTSL